MNKQIRKLVAGLLVLYVGLFAALNFTQVVRKEALDADVVPLDLAEIERQAAIIND